MINFKGSHMQFLILGYDGTDEEALTRRMAAREEHLALGETMRQEGKLLFATAILNDEEKMIGSMLVVNFNSRSELDSWFQREPYVTGRVWERTEIRRCKVGPSFLKAN